MIGVAMHIQSSPIRPLFYEYEMSRVFLIYEKIVGYAKRLGFCFFHQFAIQRNYHIDAIWLDEVLSDDFEHKLRTRYLV